LRRAPIPHSRWNTVPRLRIWLRVLKTLLTEEVTHQEPGYAARLAVRAYVDESRHSNAPLADVILCAVDATKFDRPASGEASVRLIVRWILEDYYR
jgi:hypothetical protein